MANSLTKEESIAWEHGCEAFENLNVFANNADIFKPEQTASALSGQTQRIPYANQLEVSRGLDITSSFKDVADITVPISLAKGDLYNGPFQLDVNESSVQRRVTDNVDAAIRRISSEISKDCANLAIDRGVLCQGFTGNLTNYNELSSGSTMLDEVEATGRERHLYLPPRIHQGVANELGSRATDNRRDMSAYERGQLPMISDMMTHKTNSLKQIGANSATTVTVNGASQDVTPVAYNSDGGYAAGETDDVRTQVLTVTNTSGSLTNGDIFTIAGVNRIGIDSKEDTGQLMTFRVVSGGGTTSVTISPAIVASGAYQNVSAAPADGAAITAVNSVAATPSVFTSKDAFMLYCDELNWEALEGSAGVVLGTYTTTSGIQVAFLKQGSIKTGVVDYRLSAWCKPNLVDPLKCGLILPNQSTAF
jgi:hypothetical protein